MFNCSHPSVRRAQQQSNQTQRTLLLVPNMIGGIDVIRGDGVFIDFDREITAVIGPQVAPPEFKLSIVRTTDRKVYERIQTGLTRVLKLSETFDD